MRERLGGEERKKRHQRRPIFASLSSSPSFLFRLPLSHLNSHLIDHRSDVVLGRPHVGPPFPGLGDVGVQVGGGRGRDGSVGRERRRQRQRRRRRRRRRSVASAPRVVLGALGRSLLLTGRSWSHDGIQRPGRRKDGADWSRGGGRRAQEKLLHRAANKRRGEENERKKQKEKWFFWTCFFFVSFF